MTLSPFRSNIRLTPRFDREPPAKVLWGVMRGGRLPLVIGVTRDRAICRLSFMQDGQSGPAPVLDQWREDWPATQFVRDQAVIDHLSRNTDLQVSMTGTPFQHAVWKALLDVPPGKTVSYGALAERIKKPSASRAVGAACGANPVPLLVPCHRVLASDGKLGGFSCGLSIKRLLLQAEGVIAALAEKPDSSAGHTA